MRAPVCRKELHRCPGPESAVLGGVEVQERPGRVAGAGTAVLGADEDSAADCEGRARRHCAQGVQTSQAVAVAVGCGPGKGFQGRETFAGALVHAGFDPLGALGVQGLRFLDRARRRPWPPAGRLLHRPACDVEIERAHRHHQQGPVGPLDHRLLHGAVQASAPLDPRAQAFLPGGDHLRWQIQGSDAGVVPFQIRPEVPGQVAGQVVQRAVVQPVPPLLQVVDQQPPDLRTLHPVPVHQLFAGELTGEPAQQSRSVVGASGADGPARAARSRTGCSRTRFWCLPPRAPRCHTRSRRRR